MKIIVAMAAALVAAGCAADEPVAMDANSEAKLAAALQGYEAAGPPVDCVNQRDLGGNRSVGEDAIIFNGRSSGTLYVNRPAGGCPSMDFGRSLLVRATSSQLCRGDLATVFDVTSRIEYGSCGLGDFEPYKRVRDGS